MPMLAHGHHDGGQSALVPVYYPHYWFSVYYLPWFGWGGWLSNWTTCPSCMAMVRMSSNYCSYCGNPMPQPARAELKRCGACGSEIRASSNFCQECGEDTRDVNKLKMRMRFLWLSDLERRYGSDHARFRAVGLPNAEDDKEEPVFEKAKKKAKDANAPVTVNVVLFEKRGEIDSFPWALVQPNGTIEHIYR